MRSRRWDELSWTKKGLIMVLTAVQVSLAVSAWADLAARPADQVNGPKRKWALLICVNFIGPIAYFARGRRTTGDAATPGIQRSSNSERSGSRVQDQ